MSWLAGMATVLPQNLLARKVKPGQSDVKQGHKCKNAENHSPLKGQQIKWKLICMLTQYSTASTTTVGEEAIQYLPIMSRFSVKAFSIIKIHTLFHTQTVTTRLQCCVRSFL